MKRARSVADGVNCFFNKVGEIYFRGFLKIVNSIGYIKAYGCKLRRGNPRSLTTTGCNAFPHESLVSSRKLALR